VIHMCMSISFLYVVCEHISSKRVVYIFEFYMLCVNV